MRVDPRAEKYHGMTPFNGMGNNPVLMSDLQGDTIRILNSNQEFITYTPGMNYEGDDDFVAKTISTLNSINESDSGAEVLGKLADSQNFFNVVEGKTSRPDAGASFDPFAAGGGILWLSKDLNDRSDFSHELFHGYQHETGLTDVKSVAGEVGAYLFQDVIEYEIGAGSGILMSDNPEGLRYDQAHNDLLFNGYSQSVYETAVTNFKRSYRNSSGLYNNYSTRIINNREGPAIRKFIPLK